MEILNIENTNNESLNKIRNCEFKHHFDDVDDNSIIQIIVSRLSEETIVKGYDTITDIIYEVVLIYLNDDNQKIKRTTKIQQKKTTSRIPKRVLERRNLPKFGKALDSNNGVTMLGDEVSIEPVNDTNIKEPKQQPKLNLPKNSNMKFSDRRKITGIQAIKYKNYRTT